MNLVGYLLLLAGLTFLYTNVLVLGGVLVFAGGMLAQRMSLSIRSAGVMVLLLALAYGYHYEFTEVVLLLLLVGFLMASTRSRSLGRDTDWGIDIDWRDWGGDGDGDGGGDGGGD
ncbi:MAG: hypothetical protein SV765_03240 [Pseudomonadota bacterium]|nr:hypothetical protein [Pseudomonadales bacterium]MDY6919208.1 hypothetical protein [Pseudomonadota bacterium]